MPITCTACIVSTLFLTIQQHHLVKSLLQDVFQVAIYSTNAPACYKYKVKACLAIQLGSLGLCPSTYIIQKWCELLHASSNIPLSTFWSTGEVIHFLLWWHSHSKRAAMATPITTNEMIPKRTNFTKTGIALGGAPVAEKKQRQCYDWTYVAVLRQLHTCTVLHTYSST